MLLRLEPGVFGRAQSEPVRFGPGESEGDGKVLTLGGQLQTGEVTLCPLWGTSSRASQAGATTPKRSPRIPPDGALLEELRHWLSTADPVDRQTERGVQSVWRTGGSHDTVAHVCKGGRTVGIASHAEAKP